MILWAPCFIYLLMVLFSNLFSDLSNLTKIPQLIFAINLDMPLWLSRLFVKWLWSSNNTFWGDYHFRSVSRQQTGTSQEEWDTRKARSTLLHHIQLLHLHWLVMSLIQESFCSRPLKAVFNHLNILLLVFSTSYDIRFLHSSVFLDWA